MTIIVAVKTDERIIIGADKRVTEDDTIVSENTSKILVKDLTVESFIKNNEYEQFLIAFSGVTSLLELLKTFTPPHKDANDSFMEYLYKIFIPKLNSHLQNYNFIKNYNNGQTGVEWELLIAYKHQLFLVEFNLGIVEINTPYYATGAPRDIALGSLYTTSQDDSITSNGYKVATAIRACAAHHVLCNDDFELYTINTDGKIEQYR